MQAAGGTWLALSGVKSEIVAAPAALGGELVNDGGVNTAWARLLAKGERVASCEMRCWLSGRRREESLHIPRQRKLTLRRSAPASVGWCRLNRALCPCASDDSAKS